MKTFIAKSRAFSLVELLIVLTLMVILLFFAAPAWNNLISRNNATIGAEKLMAALQFTRLEAIKRSTNVSLCKQTSDWTDGIIVKDEKGTLIRTFEALPNQDKLFWRGNFSNNSCVTFTPLGITNGQNGTFVYCPKGKADNALAIIIQIVGEIHIATSLHGKEQISCSL